MTMGRVRQPWLVVLLLLGTLSYALAEDVTLTTYYPSPRGVYNELRANTAKIEGDLIVNGNTLLGNETSDTLTFQAGTLTIPNGLAVDGQTLVLDAQANRVGFGTWTPENTIDVAGGMVVGAAYAGNSATPAPANGLLVEGTVGIGTATPGATLPGTKLEVGGTTLTDTLALVPQAVPPPQPAEGMLYFNQAGGKLYLFANGEWRTLAQAMNQLVAKRTLPADFHFNSSFQYVIGGGAGGLCTPHSQVGTSSSGCLWLTVTLPYPGIYQVSWSGQVSVEAKPGYPLGIQAVSGGPFVGTGIDWSSYTDPTGLDGTPSTYSFSGSKIVYFNQLAADVSITGGGITQFDPSKTKVHAGATLVLESVLPF